MPWTPDLADTCAQAYVLVAKVIVLRYPRATWAQTIISTERGDIQSGQFTAYVEFGQLGRYRLRVLDPDSGVTSRPFVLVIKG